MSANPGESPWQNVAVRASLSEQRLERLKSRGDPMIVPLGDRRLVMAEFSHQVTQHAQIIDRVDVAGDDVGERPNPRPVGGLLWQERWLGVELVEVFQDRH